MHTDSATVDIDPDTGVISVTGMKVGGHFQALPSQGPKPSDNSGPDVGTLVIREQTSPDGNTVTFHLLVSCSWKNGRIITPTWDGKNPVINQPGATDHGRPVALTITIERYQAYPKPPKK